jgi:hypothetical protein
MTTHIRGYFEFRKDCQVSSEAFSARYVYFFAASQWLVWYRDAEVSGHLLHVDIKKAYGEVEI